MVAQLEQSRKEQSLRAGVSMRDLDEAEERRRTWEIPQILSRYVIYTSIGAGRSILGSKELRGARLLNALIRSLNHIINENENE